MKKNIEQDMTKLIDSYVTVSMEGLMKKIIDENVEKVVQKIMEFNIGKIIQESFREFAVEMQQQQKN